MIDSFVICTFKNAYARSFKNCNLYKTCPVDHITECEVQHGIECILHQNIFAFEYTASDIGVIPIMLKFDFKVSDRRYLHRKWNRASLVT